MPDDGKFQAEDVRDAVACIGAHQDWMLEGSDSLEQLVEKSVEAVETGHAVEFRFGHTDTDGVLLVEIPDFKRNAVLSGTLEQGFDCRQRANVETDPFLAQLSESHSGIAGRYQTRHITPLYDPVSVLRFSVPQDYSRDQIQDTIDNVALASKEVQQLHQEISETLKEYSQE